MKHLLSDKEELLNVITHGAGLLLGAGFLPILLWEAWLSDKPFAFLGVAVFGLSMVLMFAASTFYHAEQDPVRKELLKKLDHIAIFVLIAGTYTPFLILFYEPPLQYEFLALMWGIALVGSIFKYFYTGKYNFLSTMLYLFMGWMVVFMGDPIFQGLSAYSLAWLVAGGIGYSLGTIFYLWERLRFGHAIWHIFVIVGSASHFLAVLTSLWAS